jgi:hypothetical protein
MIDKKQLIYLSCPYTHEDRMVQIRRANLATVCTNALMKQSYHVFSPLTYSTAPGIAALTYQQWIAFDLKMLQVFDAVLVLDIDGWHISGGVALEVQYARAWQKPIAFVSPAGKIYESHALLSVIGG